MLIFLPAFSGWAEAGFIRLVPRFTVAPAVEQKRSLLLSGSVLNEGDETANQVVIEVVRSGEIVSSLGDLNPNERAEFSVLLPPETVGISAFGSYQIPFRVHYEDANGVNFSAAFLVSFVHSDGESRFPVVSPVRVDVDRSIYRDGGLQVFREQQIELTITNSFDETVDIDLSFIASRELRLQPSGFSRMSLSPHEKRSLSAEVINHSGLVGSSYATYILVEGDKNGSHFSEHTSLVVKIISSDETSYLTWVLAGLLIVFMGGGLVYWRRERRGTRQDC